MVHLSPHRLNYVLMHKLVVPEPNQARWSMWMGSHDPTVGDTRLGGARISTRFLGIDLNYGRGTPLVFETMIFRGGEGREQWRCGSWQEAENQHKRAIALVRAEIRDGVDD